MNVAHFLSVVFYNRSRERVVQTIRDHFVQPERPKQVIVSIQIRRLEPMGSWYKFITLRSLVIGVRAGGGGKGARGAVAPPLLATEIM